MTTMGLWLRWSWRDLRERWLQVLAIGMIIALGTGVYAGLGSTTPWRTESTDRSYAHLNMYDLRVTLTAPSFVDQGALVDAIRRIEHADWIEAVEPRLIAPKFVHVTEDERDVLVRGRIVGMAVHNGGPTINGIHIDGGRAFTPADDGRDVAILDLHFADYYHLPDQGQLWLSDRASVRTLDYVGVGMSPEFFQIHSEEGAMWVQANYAVVFVPLATAQALTGHSGQVNDAVVTLVPGADAAQAQAEIAAALTEAFPGVGHDVMLPADDVVYRMSYDQIEMNQEVYDIIAIMFLAGAIFGAFNLASRLVEAQRRQIGIGMALGMSPRLLMVRPLLVGAQIAVLGVLFGILLGLAFSKATELWIKGLLPMPVYGRLFHLDIFLEGAVLGLVLPLLATMYPVWRAVRVPPIDAIATGHLVAKNNGLTPLLAGFTVPGRSFVQMPVRNLLRAPRRTILTVLGIAAAITTLVGLVGMLDTVLNTLDSMRAELYQDHPERMVVYLDFPYSLDSEQVTALMDIPDVSLSTAALRVPGNATHGDRSFPILLEALDMANPLWAPTIVQGQAVTDRPGIVISRTAAEGLGVGIGDTIMVEHPRATLAGYDMVQTPLPVIGLHADSWRTFMYIDRRYTGLMNLPDHANLLYVDPAPGTGPQAIKRALFERPGVASVISIRDTVNSTQALLSEVVTFLSWVEVGVVVMAFLIAFNSTNINMSERARETATMLAFGLPVRTVTRMIMLENLLAGVLGTLVGSGLGWLTLVWFFSEKMPEIMPEVRFNITVSPLTLMIAVAVGVGLVALTPLLMMRKIERMDIPSTLRVME